MLLLRLHLHIIITVLCRGRPLHHPNLAPIQSIGLTRNVYRRRLLCIAVMLLATQLTLQNEKEDIILIESSIKFTELYFPSSIYNISVQNNEIDLSGVLQLLTWYFIH